SPAIMDSISSELMSKAGASDAAAALKLVSGASVQDGKYAVIRGLPDRYVSSQLNGVRLPTADENKRAVELDQFPAAVIDSIQVTKTFTPDQQGDASGGAVNLVLKSVPDENLFQVNTQVSANSQVYGEDEFLSYDGGGIDFLGHNTDNPQLDKLGQSWDGAVGVSTEDAPTDYKTSVSAGGSVDLDEDVRIGGFASLFYERDSSYYDDGVDDQWWLTQSGAWEPQKGGAGLADEFRTSLFDVTQGTQTEQWGGLGTVGVETEKHSVGLTYFYTKTTDDTATLAEDTRGKEFFFPDYDPANPDPALAQAAPYQRYETLSYRERTTDSWQLRGQHTLPGDTFSISALKFDLPEVDWYYAKSKAKLDEPDKRQFAAVWYPENALGFPFPAFWQSLPPQASAFLGNVQRTWKTIDEDSDQYAVNLKLPFEQWSGDDGFLKFGLFDDQVNRSFDQDTFSNFNDPNGTFFGEWEDYWSAAFPSEDHPITESTIDVDYKGDQQISAFYGMVDLPLNNSVKFIGGARFESTDLSIVNDPEADAKWFPPGSSAPVDLLPGDADVDFSQDDVLPSLGLEYEPWESLVLRSSYSQTVARQTFKELTPIIQQEYLGGDIFIGNPNLEMSDVTNYDLRADYTPYEGGFFSASWFLKEVDGPIEYVQKPFDFTFTTAENYPEGQLSGFELEARQQLDRFWESAQGLSAGVNATFIDSTVDLPDSEILAFEANGHPISSRDMTDAPEHLYNLYLNYELPDNKTQVSVFYTITGDTLVAGDGTSNTDFVPAVYAKEFGTLNLTMSRKISDRVSLIFQGKNLTNPKIEEVYRSSYIPGDTTRTSYTAGREFAVGLSIRF
ncbi:MAG TPA: TonB-dependent receptor, partial [Planctomycetota bacterium]|nr:TonB-dependent receptor [Planctomycetota bacterium]